MRLRKDDDENESFRPWGSDGDEQSESAEPAARAPGPGPGPDGGFVSAPPPRRLPSESVLPSPRHRAPADRRTAGSPNRLRRGKAWGAPDRRNAVGPSGSGRRAPAPASELPVGPAAGLGPQASAPPPSREQPRRTKVATALGSRRQDLALLLLAVVVAALVALAVLG